MAYISRFKQDFDDIEYLGKGGYGIVMKARNKIDGQYYAVKRVNLPSRQAGRDKAQKEAVALAKLNHSNIVRYFHAWEESPPPGFQETEDDKIIPTDVSSLPSATDSASEAGTLPTEQSTRDDDLSITFEKSSSSTSFSDAIETASTPSSPSSSSTEGSSNHDYTTDGTTSLENSISEKEDTKTVAQTTYLYIQMELCKTETLADWLKENPEREETTCVDIIRQIASGLQYVHERGFIHRDLNPSNIFFSLDKVVKIGDFGLVTSIIDENETMANVEADDNVNGVGNGVSCHTKAVGRALYRSREQRDGLTYNIKTDIFALGIINFELLHPMDTSMERVEVLRKVKEGQFPEDFGFNETNADLVRRLLDADPKKRPDAAQFLKLLNTQGASKLSTKKNSTGPIESSMRATEKSAGTRERFPGAVMTSPGARERSPGTNKRSPGTRERSYGIREWSPEKKHHSSKITRPIGKPDLLQTHSLTQSQQADGLSLAICKLDHQAKSMFQLTGYMDKSQIPLVILKEDVNDSPLMRSMALDNLVMQVEGMSLGKVDGIGNDRLLSVDEVTQLAVRLSLTDEQKKERLEKLQNILLKYFVKDNRFSRPGKLAELLQPHVGKVLQFVKEASDDVSFSLALARLSEVHGFMKTQCGMFGNAEDHLRAAKDHIEQLAGIDWREVKLPVAERLDSGFYSYEEHGRIEEQNVNEAEAIYSKLNAASKRLPDELFTAMIQSRVIAKQDLALFSALGKAPAGLDESVTNKEAITPTQYETMVENGIAIPIKRMKEVYLPELYASISYSLGRCFFYMKEKYANDQAGKDDLIRNMRLAYYVCDQIKNHTGISVLHKYLSERNALLYLRLEEEGKSQDELRRDIKFAIERYSELLKEDGEYFEFGILKKSGQDSYSLMICHRQLVKCFNLLLKHSDSEDEHQACIYQAQKKCEKMIEHAEKQMERDAYGNILERPEQLYGSCLQHCGWCCII